MNIGFDLDKVFINFPPMVPGKLVEKLYKKRDDRVLLYRMPSQPEQLFRKFTHLPLFRSPIKKNMEFLKTISGKNNDLYLISSRFKFLEKETKGVIKRNKLDRIFKKMYFNFENKQPHEFKNEVISKLKLDIFVDDDLSLLRFVAKRNPKVKYFWLNDDLDNKKIAPNIFAIKEISAILKK